jgi:hypothetical protein
MTIGFLPPADYNPNHADMLRDLLRVTQGLMQGKSNNVGAVTLAANTTATIVTLAKGQLSQDTVILLAPTTANAKTEGIPFYSKDVANNQFTLTHTNKPQTDRIYGYVLIG